MKEKTTDCPMQKQDWLDMVESLALTAQDLALQCPDCAGRPYDNGCPSCVIVMAVGDALEQFIQGLRQAPRTNGVGYFVR